MFTRKSWSKLMLAVPLVLVAACSRGDDREALKQEELARDLELALQGDSVPATFEDTAAAVAPPETTRPTPVNQPPAKPAQPKPTPARPVPEPVRNEPPVTEPPAPRTVESNVPSGTTMQLTLNETLSTETNVVGDAFTATLTDPVLGLDGDVLIPAGATVRGRVTQVQKSGRVGETAILNLAFESISFDGESHPFDASVVSANPERVNRSSTGEQVGKVAAGAAAGAILGRVLGKNTKSTIKGAVVGAAAGTAIAMGTADVDAVLKSGSLMVIKMEAPLRITRIVG